MVPRSKSSLWRCGVVALVASWMPRWAQAWALRPQDKCLHIDRLLSRSAATNSDTDNTAYHQSALISVEESLALYRRHHESQGHEGSSPRQDIHFVDASWYHKGNRSGRDEFEKGPRLAGAVYFDLDDICDRQHDVPRMLPTPPILATALEALGIGPLRQKGGEEHVQRTIIIYGKAGARFTPRVWFTLANAYACCDSATRVLLMQGTLEDWMALGGPVETHPVTTWRLADAASTSDLSSEITNDFHHYPSHRVASLNDMKQVVLENSDTERRQVGQPVVVGLRR